MRPRHALAVAAAAFCLAALAAPVGAAAEPVSAPRCAEKDLTLRAAPSDDTDGSGTIKLSVRNDSSRACLVDRVPTVTYGDLDGAALPVPASPHRARTLAAHTTAYAEVRSLTASDGAEKQAPTVMYVTVAAAPDQQGHRFQVLDLGAPAGLPVWEPVTTLWQTSPSRADRVLHQQATQGVMAV
ncbi:DUF4232 domain-containing protein [Streptomyces beihaiensis]|uniref:DUF4232 domain-containing protein n=1 Tax=Streptomyces beihaiensis TaxID=2984495 RepID=A0ABT3U2J9_9ACTN|nr:DUF4232 domain-containing protein [Streptomyces beihaiensis]MCX3062832.1 DUF4232 domain-containing protein [Streptomyces beihaiensis]